MDSGKISSGPGEVSFSCYLRSSEESLINKLGESFRQLNHSITSSPEFPSSRSLGRTKTAEGELGIFGAEKYYNMKLEEGPIIIDTASSLGHGKRNQVDLLSVKSKSRPGTPSVGASEASWNSKTALLPTYQQKICESKQKKVQGKSFFAALSCNGSCSDKKSVCIDQQVEHGVADRAKEAVQVAHSSPVMLDRRKLQPKYNVKDEFHSPSTEKLSIPPNKDEVLAVPIAQSAVTKSLAVKKHIAKGKIMEEEESRRSLDVFGSRRLNKEVIEANLERKLSMLTWDAIPKGPNFPTPSVRSHVFDEIESDASSDLFEIDNISGSNGLPFFARQTSDGMSSCMTPTPYEPSEASIEWSVVTASAAEFSTVSDYDEKKLVGENVSTPRLSASAYKMAKSKSIAEKDTQGSLPIKLLGCKSNKAVRVAESAYRISEKPKSYRPQQPVRKFKVETDNRFLSSN